MSGLDLEQREVELLLAGVQQRYGYDFNHYSRASLKRRLDNALEHAGVPRFTALLDKLFHDEKAFDDFLKHLSITVTEMFRDPPFYRAVREKVVPVLKTFPFVKMWHAGCATGEEVYSMAILLDEENFLSRGRIYGTDFNKQSLDLAQKGVYAAKNIESYAANYRAVGGKRDLSEYFTAGYDFAMVKDRLKEHVTFSYHNLVTDGVFGEMNLICCRNVLIYFDQTLQSRVLSLLADSLRHGGFLCLGSKESMRFSPVQSQFEVVDLKQRIYRKCGGAHASPAI